MAYVRIRKEGRRRGAAAVEAAIVMPILLLITFGAIKYGWLFMRAQQITNAARYGARMAILPGAESNNIKIIITNLLDTADITVNSDEIAIKPGDLSIASGGAPINVQITIPTDRVDILDISWFPVPENISASVTMAKEGQ